MVRRGFFRTRKRVPTSNPAVREIAEETGIDIAGQAMVNLPRHPSQLYEAFLEGVLLWAVMWFIFRPRKPFRGFMIGVYLIGYSIARFIAEYFRAPDPGLDFVIQWGPSANPRWLLLSPWNFTTGQVLSAIMALAGCRRPPDSAGFCTTGHRGWETFDAGGNTDSGGPPKKRRGGAGR